MERRRLLKGRIYYATISLCSSMSSDLCARFVAQSKRCWNISADTWSFFTGRIQKARGTLQSAGFHSSTIPPRPKKTTTNKFFLLMRLHNCSSPSLSLQLCNLFGGGGIFTPVVERPSSKLRKGQTYTYGWVIWACSWFGTFSSTDRIGAWRWWVFD